MYTTVVAKIIDDTPTIDPERLRSQWIPVTERLPDYDPDPGEYFPMLIISTKRDGVIPGIYNECQGEWLVHRKTFFYDEIDEEDVIAWMPMPEPYDSEDIEKEGKA